LLNLIPSLHSDSLLFLGRKISRRLSRLPVESRLLFYELTGIVTCNRLYKRKFFYLFTCEYCFGHYVTVSFLVITRFKLLFTDWRGYLISGFALVWLANQLLSEQLEDGGWNCEAPKAGALRYHHLRA
jgi:hypothetical protein